MEPSISRTEKTKRGAEDSGKYFRYMAEFIGFTQEDAETIRRTKPYVAGRLSGIVSAFYAKLLRYPPTRKYFIRADGTVDQDYLELRMRHLTNFWLRTAEGVFDDDYARYVDYVGKAHTSHGADPHIYIAERYVIGQVGFMQNAISQVIHDELGHDSAFAHKAEAAWDKLMMVLLELLARAYGNEREAEKFDALLNVNTGAVGRLAEHAFDHELGVAHRGSFHELVVCREEEIPEGERKILAVDGLSIGIFHHQGRWVALRNSCLHRGGPVAAGRLDGDTLTCPWHGFQYNVLSGELLVDPSAKLEMYPVTVQDGQVSLLVPEPEDRSVHEFGLNESPIPPAAPPSLDLKENEFLLAGLPSGHMGLVRLDGQEVVVYNVDGSYFATQLQCTHAGGPLVEGELEGPLVVCPWHGSRFNVTDGSVVRGPAKAPLHTFRVVTEGDIGRVVFET
jgi:nitrite reductase/ring-hydroxylating ferredoxin subunit